MASAQNSIQDPQMKVMQHNHIIIKYQQPLDPAIVNHVLELLVRTTRSFTKKNPVQIPYIQDYIDQIIPFLQILYSQSAQQILQQGGVPPPTSNTIYLPPTCSNLQQLLNELSGAQSLPLGMMTHLNSETNTEQSVQPSMTFQANRIIEIQTYNILSIKYYFNRS